MEKLTERSTDVCHRLEDHVGEADRHLDGFHVGELQQQGFVLRCVVQVSISLCDQIILNHIIFLLPLLYEHK